MILKEIALFPPVSYFNAAIQENGLLIEACENYQKRSLRNKFQIADQQGIRTLSVPLKKGKHAGQNIREVEISYDENWTRIHLRTLSAAYSNSPYFDYYYPIIESVYDAQPSLLWDLCLDAMHKIAKALRIEPQIEFTIEFKANPQDVRDFRNRTLPFPPTPYNQVFESKHGFIPNLSVIDLLMNTGPEARSWITHPLNLC